MDYRARRASRTTRVAAGVALVAMGTLLFEEMPAAGIAVLALGLAITGYQGVQLWRERPDRYDLSQLWDREPEEPVADVRGTGELPYCHYCGASMSRVYSICPECGRPLGG